MDLLFLVFFRLMAIQQCDLVLVHIYPQGEETLVSDRPKKEVGASEESNIIAVALFGSKKCSQSVGEWTTFREVLGFMWPLWLLTPPSSLGVPDLPSANQRGAQRSSRAPPRHQTQHSGPAALWPGLHHHHKHPHEGEAPLPFHLAMNTPCPILKRTNTLCISFAMLVDNWCTSAVNHSAFFFFNSIALFICCHNIFFLPAYLYLNFLPHTANACATSPSLSFFFLVFFLFSHLTCMSIWLWICCWFHAVFSVLLAHIKCLRPG